MILNKTPTTTLIESLILKRFSYDAKSKANFLRESVDNQNIGRVIFCLQEQGKTNGLLDRIMSSLGDNSSKYEAEIKNRIEKSNDELINTIFKSNGDFSKVPQMQLATRLLNISININTKAMTNLSGTKKFDTRTISKQLTQYNEAAGKLLSLINTMNRKRNDWIKVINAEKATNKEYSKKFYSQLYCNIILYIYIITNTLYSMCIQLWYNDSGTTSSAFNTNSTFVFRYDDRMDEPMTIISDIQTLVNGSELFTQRLTEGVDKFMGLVEGGEYNHINEGFLDVVHALITNTGIGQVLMLPVYFIRSVTYFFLYLGNLYSTLSHNISTHIKVLSDNKMSEEEFAVYKKEISDDANKTVSAFNTSQMAIKHEVNRMGHSKQTVDTNTSSVLI